ncbi:MAG: TRAM domain-containing protein, partial [Candidatus Marinimicrobia bacterium]|nr:TRAM domain-containing protein [Candidatus Neomarinimicrobiota bacterium]
ERLNRIIAKQKKHTTIRNRQTVGTVQTVLIDGSSKKDVNEKIGRTDSNKLLILKEGNADIGDLIDILITGAAGVSLFGKIQKS